MHLLALATTGFVGPALLRTALAPGPLIGRFDPLLVGISVAVAMLASFTAFALADRVATASGRLRAVWLAAGAVALGAGMWAMHFVGMLSFRLPIDMAYRIDYLVVALAVAIGAAAVALWAVSRSDFGSLAVVRGAVLLGAAFVIMHVLGMHALHTAASVSFRPPVLLASVVIAVGVSLAALGLAWRSPGGDSAAMRRGRGVAALGVGAAMAGMHYTAMAAAVFVPAPHAGAAPARALLPTLGLAGAVIVATFSVLALALAGALGDRYLQAQAQQLSLVRSRERALRETEERQRLALETGRLGSWRRTLATGEVEASERCRADFGLGPSEPFTFARLLELIHPDDRERVRTGVQQAIERHELYEAEYRIVRPDGQLRWIASRGQGFYSDAGEPTTIVGFTVDITERKERETAQQAAWSAVRKSEARFRALVTATTSVVWTSDALGAFVEPQDSWEAYTGQPWAGHQGMGWTAMVHAEDRDELRALWDGAVGAGSIYKNRGRLWCARTQTYRHFTVRAVPVTGADGTVREWTGMVSDVEEQRLAEERLRQMDRMEAVGQLAGGIAHEANNQMSVVLGCAEFMLKRADIPTAVRQDVEYVRQAAERTATITAQLLAFSRRQLLQSRELAFNDLIRSMAPILQRTLGESGTLALDLDPSLGLIKADPGQLEQVLLNLTLNARDAMPQGGRLLIETRPIELTAEHAGARPGVRIEPGRYVALNVSDTGRGMDGATMSRIFEPFFTTKAAGQGTGLGLSTVYGIVKQSGGYIWPYSEPQVGTTFKIYLPVTAQAAAVAAAPARPAAPAGRGETALVVDDDALVRGITVRALAEHGYHVLQADRGQAALELLNGKSEPIDVLVTDVAMPGMGGRELATRVAALRPGLPVLFISGYTDDDVIRRGLLEQGQPFLQKPFTPDELARRVHHLLRVGPTSVAASSGTGDGPAAAQPA